MITVAIAILLTARLASAQTAGCQSGRLTDAKAYFYSLVAGTDASNFRSVLANIDARLKQYGIWQQRTSGGELRGRLFLPYMAAGYVPGDPFYEHSVDVVDSSPSYHWVWVDRGGPAYAPYPCDSTEPPPPPPDDKLVARVTALEANYSELKSRVGSLDSAMGQSVDALKALDGRVQALEQKPFPSLECRASLAGIPLSCRVIVGGQ